MDTLKGYRHPKLEEALQICPGNEGQVNIAFQVYMDLCEAKTWHRVELHHCGALNMMFVSARRGEGQPREVFLPTDVTMAMSQEDIHTHFQHLVIGDKQTHSLTLAVCDSDTSTVYYKLSDTLLPPAPPDVTEEKKRRRQQYFQHRRQHLPAQAELFRMEREEKSRVSALEGTCDLHESS
ncbi:tRNA-splicing endonuclease subunit Sen15-like [Haliotis cracherodii]|uniref:tRNA-splicing endonuclease subunit Sen15-like n=1 Tax=Haliotis cracherodii TaxID=6455 RepID=UPI0039ECF1F1